MMARGVVICNCDGDTDFIPLNKDLLLDNVRSNTYFEINYIESFRT
jgi:hypothetical protein